MKAKRVISVLVLIAFVTAICPSSAVAQATYETKPTVAILNFQSNTGDESIDAMLSTGSAETIMTDLSKIDEIAIVERTRIVEVMKEIELGMTDIVDERTAQQAGNLLMAGYILTGHWQRFGDQYRVNARLVKVETGEVIASIKQTGNENSVFDLQDNISEQILSNLEISISEADKLMLRKKETVSIDAYKEFSRGLVEYDKGDQYATNYHMNRALEYDPDYAKPKEYIWVSGGTQKPGMIEKAIGFDKASTKGGFTFKQVIIGAALLGGAGYLAMSVGSNKPTNDDERSDRNKIVLGLAAFGGLTGLVIGLSSKKVEKE